MARMFHNAVVIEWHYIAEEGQPKTEGSYLVASTRNQHRVFSAHYRPRDGWALKSKGRYVYAWATLPDFPPLSPQI